MESGSENASATMDTSNVNSAESTSPHQSGTRTDEPVQLIDFVRNDKEGNTTIQLNRQTTSRLLEKAGNRPLSIICICGPSRQGKSFMLGYMIRCLEALEKEDTDWMDWENKKRKLEGFKFRNGTAPETQGIWVWSRPFIVKNDEDKEVAVLLVDTQGTYDEFTTNKDMAAIVGLSLLTSSVMIFNLFTNLQEDVLASMNTYTSYGQLALDNTKDDSTPFQKLVFLIRDWNNPGEYPYGAKGGQRFLEGKLKVKQDQPPEAKQVRESIKKCFKDLDCFLMPNIGEKALYESFTGSVDELAPNFARKMEEFINELISSETLVIKEILGNVVTADELMSFLENYIGIFNSNEVPSAKGMWEASVDVHNSHMVRKACSKFQELVKKKLRGNSYLKTEELEKAQKGAFKQAVELFKKARKFGTSEKIQEYQDELEKSLEKEQKEMKKQNEEKRNKYLHGVVNDAITHFRTMLNDSTPLDDDEDDESIVFYEDIIIKRAIQEAKESAIKELEEKMENEDDETVKTKVGSLEAVLEDSIIPSHVNKNLAKRATAEKKINRILEKLTSDLEEKLKEFHDDHPFADNEEVVDYHRTYKDSALEGWKKATKPGKKEFHKEFTAKLEKEVDTISSRFATQHQLKVQQAQKEAEDRVNSTIEEYQTMLTEKGEELEFEEELDKIHLQLSDIILEDFANSKNPYPNEHSLHDQLNDKLEEGLQGVFEHVKREVMITQQKMEESYQNAVEHALSHYKTEMKNVLDSSDFMSVEDLQAEHKRIQRDALEEYENYHKIGFPDNAINFKAELDERMKGQFKDIQVANQQKHDLAVSRAKNCVTECQHKYEEIMKPEVDRLRSNEELEKFHQNATKIAKELFLEKCPAQEDAEFVKHYENELEADIQDTFEELKDLLQMKREQEEATVKIILADCRKLYHDEMQKHCKNSSFIHPDHLDGYHQQTYNVVVDRLEKKTPLSNFQKTVLEQEMDGMFAKYKLENDMKLNSAKILPPAIGIDLGTTYCCVAVYYNGKVIIIPNQEQGNAETTASYVAYNPDGSKTIGDTAKQNAFKNPETTIYDAKRILGRKMNDAELQRDMKFWPFVVEEDGGIPKININGKLLYPEQVSAELLAEFRIMVEKYLVLEPGTITKAVITVPAYFNDGQRQATIDAGQLAGFEVLMVMNEPTAAAIAYSLERLDNTARKVLIFDLGGGTFDVAVLDVTQTSIEVLGVDGDTHLGGEDFDQKMMEYCAQKFKTDTGIDLMDGKDSTVKQERDDARRRLRRLQTYCESAKKNLSSGRTTTVSLDAMYDGEDLKVDVTRDKFEELNKAQFEKAIQIVDKALKDVGVKKEQIEDIVLVGGSTRIPKVQEMLSNYFGGKALNYSIHPDKAVAYGAAVKAAMMNGEQAKGQIDFDKIEDVTPMSLGIEVSTKEFSVIIPKNTKVPKRLKEVYQTAKDNQKSCHIKIYQGEEYMAADNELLGEFILDGIPPARQGKECIDIFMEIDIMGVLKVEAVCKSTKGSNNLTVTANKQRMSAETKSRLIAEANPAA